MDYILFGIQGTGKGTQGKILAEKFGYPYFEMGGELRKLAQEKSPLGEKVKSIIEAGYLVPNEVVMEIVEHFLKQAPKEKNIIFDGIPRSPLQAESLSSLLKSYGRDFTGIFFELSKEDALNRLLKRRICEKCKAVFPADYTANKCSSCEGKLVRRSDDTEKAILTRFENFEKETMPVISSWQKIGKMITVNSGQPIEDVTKEMFLKLGV